MSVLKLLFYLLGFIAVLWAIGFGFFISSIPEKGAEKEIASSATGDYDAIVVLTGGSERIMTALKLLKKGASDKLFISGVHEKIDLDMLAQALEIKNETVSQYKDKIYLGYEARNTMENAIEVAAWVQKNNLTDILLVTSAYHMPRGKLYFGQFMPTVDINYYPVFSSNVEYKKWWQDKITMSLIISEYHKYLIAFPFIVKHPATDIGKLLDIENSKD